MNLDKKYIHPQPIDNSVDDSDSTKSERKQENHNDIDKKEKTEDDLNKERNQGDETVGIP